MLLSPQSFRTKVSGLFYPPSSSGVGTLPTRPDKPWPRRTASVRRHRRTIGTREARRDSRPSLQAAAARSDNRTYVLSNRVGRSMTVVGSSPVPVTAQPHSQDHRVTSVEGKLGRYFPPSRRPATAHGNDRRTPRHALPGGTAGPADRHPPPPPSGSPRRVTSGSPRRVIRTI